ncbi:cytochrome-c peroxidase [Aurantiacibacter flavus]|uniref:Cytochrome-c peroxidase n=1 Tax=Aurantiacibacter flavus TaxID=3145232 RepID=A0ABV0CSJ9_9SPHN
MFLGAVGAGDDETNNNGWLREAYAGPPATWPAPELEEAAQFTEFGPLERPARPQGIAAERVALAERLFKDPRLSASGQIACESCHNRWLGWGDGLPVSFGHDRQTGNRNAPSPFTAAYMEELFWDGRAGSLEEQAHMPIANPVEMAAEASVIEERLNAIPAYRVAFASTYGKDRITMDDVAIALATFQCAIVLPTSKSDRVFSRGIEVLSDEELRGLSRTGPYMHNGLFPSLRGLVNLYAHGGGRDRTRQSTTTEATPPQPADPLLKARELSSEERQAIVAFLETL